MNETVIISAANEAYFTGLLNLVGSMHYWSPKSQIIIYDLGLSEQQLQEISHWRNAKVVHNVLGDETPAHCKQLKQYAWKPVILLHAIQQFEAILWLDAGSDIRASLEPIEKALETDGHFFVQGQDLDMTKKSHQGSYLKLDVKKNDFSGKPHFAGNLQAYIRNRPAHEKILEPLHKAALEQNCIAPPGSNLSNHRYDQTLLSILIYQSDLQVWPKTHLLAAQRNQLHSDPLQSSGRVIYTARCSSIDYVHQVRDAFDRLRYPPGY